MKKPLVDSQTCIGCGTCAVLAAGTFTLNGPTASVTNPAGNTDEELNTAAASCPTGSIVFQDSSN
jgi:ferredoxin